MTIEVTLCVDKTGLAGQCQRVAKLGREQPTITGHNGLKCAHTS